MNDTERTLASINETLEDFGNPTLESMAKQWCKEDKEYNDTYEELSKLVAHVPGASALLLRLDDRRCDLEYAVCQEHMRHTIEVSVK